MKNLVERTQALIDNSQFQVTNTVASLLLARIAELEAFNQEQGQLMSAMTEYYEGDKGVAFQAHNLEQQAKGCDDGAKACSISFGEAVVIGETELDDYAKDLLRQAKALKEQGFHFNDQE
jgi:hypothetical protein